MGLDDTWQPMPSMALGPAAEFGIPSRDSWFLFSLFFFSIYVAQYQSGGKDAYVWLHSYCSTGDEKKW